MENDTIDSDGDGDNDKEGDDCKDVDDRCDWNGGDVGDKSGGNNGNNDNRGDDFDVENDIAECWGVDYVDGDNSKDVDDNNSDCNEV